MGSKPQAVNSGQKKVFVLILLKTCFYLSVGDSMDSRNPIGTKGEFT